MLWRQINDLAGSLRKLALDYKTDIVGFYLGDFSTIVIDDPKLIKEALNNPDFDGRVDVIVGRLRSFWKKLGKFIYHCRYDGYCLVALLLRRFNIKLLT